MKTQTALILGLIFALVIAVFAVINVNPVTVNYLFGSAQWPLILVILFSVLLGGLAIFMFSLFRTLALKRQRKELVRQNEQLKKELHELKLEHREQRTPAATSTRLAPDGDS
ncbi:lipopolysaccharide assembly protein LapA domain-containing protein [Domibacillus indicus]|uniref:LapA family protein n=1 Tax=Domibacillus TaxID=1433999 RepID=UPI001F5AFA2B|nr:MULTISPECIES: lipopolysaccharide assembly protein LapA domain-containing protein [Domibacillus]MCI2254436.1 lipopolysaccharide assembly protein LapA domain-containing protein [Domibacillus sp. PGB-M46]MCM3786820.1 lipopolysaccharide assembly protein LapA domain-containing protein [Domibacillus indicus]WNS81860.1 lipopolysaccharide assembly protein LapA domain-containing protein [Domibacillus sp. DTU_2020_1001157_1_SI_ALB_TIR_016]